MFFIALVGFKPNFLYHGRVYIEANEVKKPEKLWWGQGSEFVAEICTEASLETTVGRDWEKGGSRCGDKEELERVTQGSWMAKD